MAFEDIIRGVAIAAVVSAAGVFLYMKEDFRQAHANAQVRRVAEIATLKVEQEQYIELLAKSGDPKLVEFSKKWETESKDEDAKYTHAALKAFVQKNLPNAIPDKANVEVVDGSQK